MADAKAKEEAPKTRKLGENAAGETVLYPSDIEMVTTQYNLTTPEAERFLVEGKHTQTAADSIKGERVVYRPHYEVVTGTNSNPLNAADTRTAEREERDTKAEAEDIAEDKSSPEAGPYGPNAVYTEVEAPEDTDHTSPQAPKAEKGK